MSTQHPVRSSDSRDADPRLQIAELTVRFGGLTALDAVSFEVGAGETVALIGPNGAGKTTVFNAVCGLVKPSAGSVRIDGVPAPASPTGLIRHGVARTLQGLGLFGGMSVLENVLVPLAAPGRSGRPAGPGRTDADAATVATETLRDLGLDAEAHRPVDSLPYPERKRVALARALVTQPTLLLLDEPAGGLGAGDIADLSAIVRRVAATGCSVLLVEHHMDFVMALADRVAVLDFGRVIACGTPGEVQADPRVEEAYLGVEVAS
ncbi:ABC transporter ATP-binding protein [Mycetocola zhujimingii]|uniref:ABC transporter ATP-binding protein n=1 Tax=Mycetocola zhujimingii TaxID=2079792 RepID=UPI000D33950B|nr:ABC transporter ATP-binding protein [Mycetocola zhujimingii]AWB86216.1 ABC transporter ATP-binding protein [Mycetocola zhujimingii]